MTLLPLTATSTRKSDEPCRVSNNPECLPTKNSKRTLPKQDTFHLSTPQASLSTRQGVFQSQVVQNWYIFTRAQLLYRAKLFFNKKVLSCGTRPLGVLLTNPFSQPEPDLSNPFLNIILANNAMRGIVRLGH